MMISVIVPFYNARNYIERFLKAFHNQTSQNYELILVDDGSNDGSKELLDTLKNTYNFVYVFQNNRGVSEARNTGVQYAKYENILFADIDDIVEKNYIERFYLNIDDNNSLICCSYNIEYPKEDRSLKKLLHVNLEKLEKDQSIFEIDVNGMLNVVWNKLFFKSILVDNKVKFNSDLKSGEDLDFVYHYCRFIKKIKIIEEPLYNYIRIDGHSTLNNYIPNLEINLDFVENAREQFYSSSTLQASEYKEFLDSCYINSKMIVLNNSYKLDAPRKLNKKVIYSIINDSKLRRCLDNVKYSTFNQVIFYFAVKSRNFYIFYLIYNVLFFMRNNMNFLYNVLKPLFFDFKFLGKRGNKL